MSILIELFWMVVRFITDQNNLIRPWLWPISLSCLLGRKSDWDQWLEVFIRDQISKKSHYNCPNCVYLARPFSFRYSTDVNYKYQNIPMEVNWLYLDYSKWYVHNDDGIFNVFYCSVSRIYDIPCSFWWNHLMKPTLTPCWS